MRDDLPLVERAYLQHLSAADLRLLVAGVDELAGRDPAGEIAAREGLLESLLARPGTFEALFEKDPGPGALVPASPFLVFAVAVERVRQDLATRSYVEEWLGPRRRMPVFEVAPLRDFLDEPWRRLLLAELLASYTRVSSGSVLVATRRGLRRQRFSELDPVRLAGLLEVVPEPELPGVYRRLGDLALFLTGVFPDHTALRGLSAVDESRLRRAGRLAGEDTRAVPPGLADPGAVELLERLGRRWYRQALELVAPPVPLGVRAAGELGERFGEARRILNHLTDRFLFPFRSAWFAGAGGPEG